MYFKRKDTDQMKKEELRELYSTIYSIEYMLNVDIGIIAKDASEYGIYFTKLDDGSDVRIDPSGILFIDPNGEDGIQLTNKLATSVIKNLTKEQMESLVIRFKYLSKKLESVGLAMSVSADLASNRIKDIIRYLY
jgi:hypothetical protein|nr:MAG TPA: hypothetical protein [Caudoviricetes sp.]